MFQPGLRPDVSQGDIFDAIEVTEVVGGKSETYRGYAILLSHDCEFDKPNHPDVLLARVFPLGFVDPGNWGAIRDGSAYNAFHIPALGAAEAFVNLRYIDRVSKDELRAAAPRRLASMTDDGRAALIAYVYRFLTRSLPAG